MSVGLRGPKGGVRRLGFMQWGRFLNYHKLSVWYGFVVICFRNDSIIITLKKKLLFFQSFYPYIVFTFLITIDYFFSKNKSEKWRVKFIVVNLCSTEVFVLWCYSNFLSFKGMVGINRGEMRSGLLILYIWDWCYHIELFNSHSSMANFKCIIP